MHESADFLDNVMTKFIVYNWRGMNNWRQFVSYDNKLSTCPLSLVDASHKLWIYVSVLLLTMKISAVIVNNEIKHNMTKFAD